MMVALLKLKKVYRIRHFPEKLIPFEIQKRFLFWWLTVFSVSDSETACKHIQDLTKPQRDRYFDQNGTEQITVDDLKNYRLADTDANDIGNAWNDMQ